MKAWFLWFVLIPAWLSAELVWQADLPAPFALTIKMHPTQLVLNEPLSFEAIFRYPSSYNLSSDALIERLTQTANPLNPFFLLSQLNTFEEVKDDGLPHFHLHAVLNPVQLGSWELSLLNVSFLPKTQEEQLIDVLTPVFILEVSPALEKSMPLAPLLPLEPEFPLGLTPANEEFLFNNPERLAKEKQHNQALLEAHAFPWIALLIFLISAGMGWTVYLIRAHFPKKEVKSPTLHAPKKDAINRLRDLQNKPVKQKGELTFHYRELTAILFKLLCESLALPRSSHAVTATELAQAVETSQTFSLSQKSDLLSFLKEVDEVKFGDKKVSLEKFQDTCLRVQKFLQDLNKKA